MTAHSSGRRRAGFTLIEIILVVAVLAIFASAVAFSAGSSIRHAALEQDALGIYRICCSAREIAAAWSRRTRVQFDTQARTYIITIEQDPESAPDQFTSPPGSWSQTFFCDPAVTVALSLRPTAEEPLAAGVIPTWITFFPDGTADPVQVDVRHEAFKQYERISVDDLTSLATLAEYEE